MRILSMLMRILSINLAARADKYRNCKVLPSGFNTSATMPIQFSDEYALALDSLSVALQNSYSDLKEASL